jgi:hypothetical protein
MPDLSTYDCETIHDLFSNNKVFPSVEDKHVRKRLSKRVLSCKRILSFQSFFEDFRYIRACFESLSILLPSGSWRKDRSFQQAFAHNWNGKTQQSGEKHTFLRCYVELWLFAMREFPYLSKGKASQPLRDDRSIDSLIRPQSMYLDKKAQLAYKASLHGFNTSEIERIRPNEIQQDHPSGLVPEYSCDDRHLTRKARSNRPTTRSYLQDKDYVHTRYMLHSKTKHKMRYATTFAVWEDIVRCCWTDEERWVAPQRRSQKGRIPINISQAVDQAGPPIDKPPRPAPFDMYSFTGSETHRELPVSPKADRLATQMEFSFGSRPDMNGSSDTPTESASLMAQLLRSLTKPDLSTGEATETALAARRSLDEVKPSGDPMDLDPLKPPDIHQKEAAESTSLKKKPLAVAIRQGLDSDEDESSDRQISISPHNTKDRKSEASSVYSSYDPPKEGSQDVAYQVSPNNVGGHRDQHLEKVSALDTKLIDQDPSVSTGIENSSETMEVSSPHYGTEAGDQVERECDLHEASSYRSSKSYEDVSFPRDSTSGTKDPPKSISERLTIPDDESYKMDGGHNTINQNLNQTEHDPVKLDKVKPSLEDKRNTQLLLNPEGTKPLGFEPSDWRWKKVLGKHPRQVENEGLKNKRRASDVSIL